MKLSKLYVALIAAIGVLLFAPHKVQANDYLEKEYHYKAYPTGADHVHFILPVWSYGRSYDFYIHESSTVWYQKKGSSTKTTFANFRSDRYDENEKDSDKGTAYINLHQGMGDIIVTSMANGVNYQIHDNGAWSEKLIVTQKEDDGHDHVTFLEFDWYPPLALEKDTFNVGVTVSIRWSKSENEWYNYTWTLQKDLTYQDNAIAPQLHTPYLYTLNEKGVAGYGYAAVPYMVFQDPVSYYTSFHPTEVVSKDVERSGTIYIPTTDTIQKQLTATFKVVRSAQTGSTMDVTTTAIDIPPYHRIYDFAVREETDSTGTFTGSNILSWNIKNAQLKDILDNDYFEIQRGLESDFSDAQRIKVVQMVRDESGEYTIKDSDREIWTGNADIVVDTVLSKLNVSYTVPSYILKDPDGVPVYELKLNMTTDKMHYPRVPVYYRIRRASSSVWGWDDEFSKTARLDLHNFLAPLATTQENYSLDKDFENNRKVNFRIKLDNREVSYSRLPIGDWNFSYQYIRNAAPDSVEVKIDYTQYMGVITGYSDVFVTIYNTIGEKIIDERITDPKEFKVPRGSILTVTYDSTTKKGNTRTYNLFVNSKVWFNTEAHAAYMSGWFEITSINFEGYTPDNVSKYMTEQLQSHLKDSLYELATDYYLNQSDIKLGRCMWDRTAQLVLQRTIEETGQTMEFIIPQDSIRRQADGSWIASYSDVANQGCSHYRYSVRIDQSRSDLHVQDSASLRPIAISGPSLYFDEAATISNFTATQEDASTAMKSGVLLRWEASSNAVDEFILLRRAKNSDTAADTIYRGNDNSYLDYSAVPSLHYEYTIVANYLCNGKATSNYATAEGWRTPFGEISGRILMPDNSGMAGVKVVLQDANKNVIRTMTTDASGEYKFDSLEYIAYKCEKAKVKISYSYNFSIWAPERQTQFCVLNASGNVLEDWSNKDEGTYEYPVGTVLQVKSEFPNVSSAIHSFTIAGHCAIDCYYSRQKNGTNYKYNFNATIDEQSDCECEQTPLSSYEVVPTHSYGTFSFNNTSAGTASVSLSHNYAVASGIDFMNTSATRLTGRVLYKNSTIPVSGAMFLLNGDTVRRDDTPVKSGIDGNFELILPLHQPCRLQVFKQGHVFEGDGILRLEGDKEDFALPQPRYGVRFYDMTKVRLVGRVAGGNDQRDLPRAFGLGNNNLGDNLQLVLQLEGDNTAQIVHDPDDLTRDTIRQTTRHIVYQPRLADSTIVGTTHTLFEKKRITIQPDPTTGEFAVDLFPVKYKVVQATANGYATLFGSGQGSETFDLTNAPLTEYVGICNKTAEKITVEQRTDNVLTESNTYSYRGGIASQGGLSDGDSIHYNAVYDRIYHAPVIVSLKQVLYGMDKSGFGEEEMEVSSMSLTDKQKVRLYQEQADGLISYLLGHPVFIAKRKYQFTAQAYERYYYNNDPQSGKVDEVPQRGGSVRIHNGLKSATTYQDYTLDSKGQNKSVMLEVEDIDTENSGEKALRTVSAALQVEDNYVETDVFQAFVSGTDIQNGDLTSTESEVVLLDIVRDPGGNGSSAWVESGTTYNFAYTENYDWKIGIELTPKFGVSISQDIGAVAAPEGAGSYLGSTYESSRQLSFTLPITHEWKWGYKYNYTFTTTDRISTSSGKAKDNVGSNADVFLGTTVSQVAGKAKTVDIISDSMYIARQPAINAGLMKVLGQGTGADGKKYYLVTGQKVVLGSHVAGTFVYTQHYILNTLIPKLALERQNLLMNFDSEEAAQDYANQIGEAVYWYHSAGDKVSLIDSLPYNSYDMIVPTNSNKAFANRVAALDNMILQWITILYQNEKEKVMARMMGSLVGTWSVSSSATITHTDSYSASAQYNEMPQGGDLVGSFWASNSAKAGQKLLKDMKNIVGFFKSMSNPQIGTTVWNVLEQLGSKGNGGYVDPTKEARQQELGTKTNTSKFTLAYNPIFSYDNNINASQDQTSKKASGFTLGADSHGDITVSVYRAQLDSVWETQSEFIRENVNQANNKDLLYGSYVFYTVAGSSYCPHEAEEKTQFYNQGTILNNETQWVDKPEMSIDTYEQTGVHPDKRATFRVTLMNSGQVQAGLGANGTLFNLSLWADSNPDGAKVYVDGAPLINAIPVFLVPGQAVVKTVEVERGTVDDYNNLALGLALADCPKTNSQLNFSVHFLPVSSDVTISMPRQNWIMNTLSQHDSVGYYIPVEIDGFDIHHKNFDHIEFQYKLSTESEEMWVNQCSFYASDSLYALASGNKAMIENGRIVPFRFYGERDPMEQRYDLRAVAFCRYGSGFVTKSSPVISGTKDTRPPRVFGEPEPVNAILGVGEHLRLRFNEPIAGNYLDEDNNFQLVGVTNETGITTNSSLHFDGSFNSYASTQVSRSLEARSYTIDLMFKPSSPNKEVTFFEHGFERTGVVFGMTADNRLQLQFGTYSIYSLPLPEPLLDFTRVVLAYNYDNNTLRFYVGTLDITDPSAKPVPDIPYSLNAPLVFGRGLEGNMLEVRLWTKALSQAEVDATYLRYLTGYEQELAAYYKMNEGSGSTVTDPASGATLQLHGTSWNLPNGISLALTINDSVALAHDLLARSEVYDATYMVWFRNTSSQGTVFRAADKRLALAGGELKWLLNDSTAHSLGTIRSGEWHHFVLAVNRTYNNTAVYLDGKLVDTYPATRMTGISGDMYLGGNGFEGNVDEFVVFEQALPKTLIEDFGNRTPSGEEMGLIAYLPFQKQVQNANGNLELVFSADDQRVFKDLNGNVINKQVTLVTMPSATELKSMADKTNYAPVHGFGLLSKLKFDWAFNQDELLINLNMEDREINKKVICMTVRDVEDLNGNPMPSPVMWMAYVDHNALKWDDRQVEHERIYDSSFNEPNYMDVSFTNHSGRAHQYTFESLPLWLAVDAPTGSVEPAGYGSVRLFFDPSLPVGSYTDIIYLTDENGLSEPLRVNYNMKAECPWTEPYTPEYPYNMSLCGLVRIGDEYDTNPDDKVIALYRNECVGMANVSFDNQTNKSKVFLTVYGNESMNRQPVHFQLWQASTGKLLDLAAGRNVIFTHGFVYGCDEGEPVLLTASGGESMNIELWSGWNWVSAGMDMSATEGEIASTVTAKMTWNNGDLIKNPVDKSFCTYDEQSENFVGTLNRLHYSQMYMVYSAYGNAVCVSGKRLHADSMAVTVRGNGQWSPMPCLLSEATPVMEALSDYFDKAVQGDMIKAHDRFAYFSADKKWEGNLTALYPGEGYLFRRMDPGKVTIHFYNRSAVAAPERGRISSLGQSAASSVARKLYNNPAAATNMTLIATLDLSDSQSADTASKQSVRVYVGGELTGIAEPMRVGEEYFYFLTVQSDRVGQLRFELEDGTPLRTVEDSDNDRKKPVRAVQYAADSHIGTLQKPVRLIISQETDSVYKTVENGNVIIIRNGERYDMTGKRLNR